MERDLTLKDLVGLPTLYHSAQLSAAGRERLEVLKELIGRCKRKVHVLRRPSAAENEDLPDIFLHVEGKTFQGDEIELFLESLAGRQRDEAADAIKLMMVQVTLIGGNSSIVLPPQHAYIPGSFLG